LTGFKIGDVADRFQEQAAADGRGNKVTCPKCCWFLFGIYGLQKISFLRRN